MTFEEHIKQFNAADERLRLRLEALAQSLELTRLSNEEAHQRFEEEHRKTEESHRKTEEAQRKTEATLRRAIALSVREARAERERRRVAIAEIDDKITKLASAQLVTEAMTQRLERSVQQFIEGRGGKNGHGQPEQG